MISARTMKKVREKGCPEVNCRRMNAIYANSGQGNTGNNEPMIAIMHNTPPTMLRTISILLQLRSKNYELYSYFAPGCNRY